MLRALDTRTFRPVGGRRDVKSDFRVVAATNEDLRELVETARFREDLAQRLSGLTIRVPPLAERAEDIPMLAAHFAELAMETRSDDGRPELSVGAMRLLQEQPWQGNVRQLRHVVEASMALADGRVVTREDALAVLDQSGACQVSRRSTPIDIAYQRLLDTLEALDWDTSAVAHAMSINRVTVYRRMKRLGITVPLHARWRRPGTGVRGDAPSTVPLCAEPKAARSDADVRRVGQLS